MNAQWCFAYTAAELFSFHFGKNISALGIGIRSYEFETKGTLRNETTPSVIKFFAFMGSLNPMPKNPAVNIQKGGSIGEATAAVREKRLCLESELPTIGYRLGPLKGAWDTTAQFFGQIQEESRKQPGRRQSIQTGERSCDFFDSARTLAPSVMPNDLRNIVREILPTRDPLIEIANQVCKDGPRVPENLKAESREWNNPTAALAYVRQNLEMGPIGIVYNSKLLKSKEAKYRPGDHASSLVGRELINGQCEYWIRNSWGNCDPDYARFPCANGHYRVPESEIAKMVKETTVLKKQ